jgi:hypothetical protein
MVNFPTWSRILNDVRRESTIDHVYETNPPVINYLTSTLPYFGEYLILSFKYHEDKPAPKPIFKKNWQSYSKDNLIHMVLDTDWTFESDSVQGYWNEIEINLVGIIDIVAPI